MLNERWTRRKDYNRICCWWISKWISRSNNYRKTKTYVKKILDTIKSIKNLYNSRDKIIKLYNDFANIISEIIYKTKQETELNILIPKKLLQRLPVALAQVKAGNSSENLLNKINQIIYSLYPSKKKKY